MSKQWANSFGFGPTRSTITLTMASDVLNHTLADKALAIAGATVPVWTPELPRLSCEFQERSQCPDSYRSLWLGTNAVRFDSCGHGIPLVNSFIPLGLPHMVSGV